MPLQHGLSKMPWPTTVPLRLEAFEAIQVCVQDLSGSVALL